MVITDTLQMTIYSFLCALCMFELVVQLQQIATCYRLPVLTYTKATTTPTAAIGTKQKVKSSNQIRGFEENMNVFFI